MKLTVPTKVEFSWEEVFKFIGVAVIMFLVSVIIYNV